MLGHAFLAAAALSNPHSQGQILVGIFLMILLAAGIAKTVSIMRRPRTSSLCVSSLLVLLCAWLGSCANRLFLLLVEPPAWVALVTSLFLCLFLLASFVLAISGLIVWGQRKGHYNQGKAQAIWSLVLTGLMLITGGAVAISNLVDETRDSAPAVANSSRRIDFKGTKDYPEFHFRIGHPERPWALMPAGKIVENALAVYTRGAPESFSSMLAEPNESQMTRSDVMQILLARLEGMADSIERLPESTQIISGLTFTKTPVKITGLNGVNVPVYYEYWVACSSEYIYYLYFWSPWSARTRLSADAVLWAETFELTTPATDAAQTGVFADRESPAAGHATSLAPLGWREETPDTFVEARFMAAKGTDYLVLVDMPLPEWSKARPQDIDDAMLEMLNIKDSERPAAAVATEHHGLPARVYDFDRHSDDTVFRFRARILQAGRRAWMLVTWGIKSGPEDGREAAAQAVRLFAPPDDATEGDLPARLVKAQGLYYNNIGIACHLRQEYRQAEQHFREALRRQPEDAAMLMNVVDALEKQAKPQDALRVLTDEATPTLRATDKVRAKMAELLAVTGKPDEALDEWKRLFDEGHENEDHLLTRINLLLEQDRPEEALAVVTTFAEKHPSAKVERWRAAVLAKNDRFDEALQLLEKRAADTSPDLEALYLKGELENDAGRYEAAEKSAAALLAAGEDSARTHLIRGWSEWHRKAWKAAREAFSKAAEKAPEDPQIKEALAMTAGALGHGSADISRTPLEPVPIPPELLEAINGRGAPPEALVNGHGAFYHHRLVGVFYQPGEPVRVTHYYKVKILDQRGLEAFNGFSHTFHPAAETVYVNRLVVTDDAGAVVQEGTNADAFTTGESGDLATGAQILQVPVPGLRKGCTVETVITIEDKSKSTTPPMRRDLLTGGFPALARGWFLAGDSSDVRFTHAQSIQPLPAAKARAFVTFDTPAFRREAFMAELEHWQPWVIAGPSGGDWKKLGADYLKRLRDRLEEDPSTQKLAARLCQGLSTPEEKLGAIVRHVQSSLTYKGLEFGTRALIPSTVAKIQADQYGDCKDHTLLMYHLLRRAGIVCHPALVDTEWKIRRDIPSLDQFDHMILYVPGVGGQPWLDATDDWLDLTRYGPESLGGRDAFILDPAGARFEKIAPTPATHIRIAREAAVQENGALAVKETVTLSGAAAAWARGWFMNAPAGERANLVRRQLDSYGHFELDSVELADADHIERPLQIHMDYVVRDAFEPGGAQLSLPFYWELDYLGVPPMENRRSPFKLSPGMVVESITRVTGLPGPAALVAASPARGRNPSGTWELTTEGKPDLTVVTFSSRNNQGDHPVSDWPVFQEDRRTMMEHLRRPLTVRR